MPNVNQAYPKVIQEEQVKNMIKEGVVDGSGTAVFAVCNHYGSHTEKSFWSVATVTNQGMIPKAAFK